MSFSDNLEYIAELQKSSGAEAQQLTSWPAQNLKFLFYLKVLEEAIPSIIFKSVVLGFGLVFWFGVAAAIEDYGGDAVYEYTLFAIATLIVCVLGYWLLRSVRKWKGHEDTWHRLAQKEIAHILERESDDSDSHDRTVDEAYEKGYYAGAMDAKNDKLDRSLFP